MPRSWCQTEEEEAEGKKAHRADTCSQLLSPSLCTIQSVAARIFFFFLYLSLLLLLLLKCEWPRIVWASRNTICLSGGARGPLQWSKGGYKRLVTRGQPTNNHKHPSYFSPTTHPPLVFPPFLVSLFSLLSLSLSRPPFHLRPFFFFLMLNANVRALLLAAKGAEL